MAQGVLDHGLVSPVREDPEAAQEVELAVPVVVDEITALAVDVEAVKAQSRHDLRQLGIEVLRVQLEVLTVSTRHQFVQVKGHSPPCVLASIYSRP